MINGLQIRGRRGASHLRRIVYRTCISVIIGEKPRLPCTQVLVSTCITLGIDIWPDFVKFGPRVYTRVYTRHRGSNKCAFGFWRQPEKGALIFWQVPLSLHSLLSNAFNGPPLHPSGIPCNLQRPRTEIPRPISSNSPRPPISSYPVICFHELGDNLSLSLSQRK